ncbi:MAG TPA: class I SAM-dependent methyltransferase [Candidatus Solibacter sp.]|jgi:ubiquinone/menaquinone biosynthesis C-methylase UbiE|nr:class I SAM-dependent methyltransferase [Candidatus Solibacter sp.]
MDTVMSGFDAAASAFDCYRALPKGVPKAIRTAIWNSVPGQSSGRVLDLGAGTGRIGKAFVAANDLYFGVDLSYGMLREFLTHTHEMNGHLPCLAQAEGQRLPFSDGTFAVVMLMQVLSGARDWRGLLAEARRVLRAKGALVVGHSVAPDDGIDSQLKTRLDSILEEMHVEHHRGRRGRAQALASLESASSRKSHVVAASWKVDRSPRAFLARHWTGARFSALPETVQKEALQKVSAWAETAFGSLDAVSSEDHNFELDIFEF